MDKLGEFWQNVRKEWEEAEYTSFAGSAVSGEAWRRMMVQVEAVQDGYPEAEAAEFARRMPYTRLHRAVDWLEEKRLYCFLKELYRLTLAGVICRLVGHRMVSDGDLVACERCTLWGYDFRARR